MKKLTVKIHEQGSAVSEKRITTIGNPSLLRLDQLYAEIAHIIEKFNDDTMDSELIKSYQKEQ